MKLISLHIDLKASWEPNAGKYEAKVEYEGQNGSIKLLLDTEVSATLLGFIGPVITQFSHRAALQLEENIKGSVEEAARLPQIELNSTTEPV